MSFQHITCISGVVEKSKCCNASDKDNYWNNDYHRHSTYNSSSYDSLTIDFKYIMSITLSDHEKEIIRLVDNQVKL
ncbi:hypothetical protein [Legionella clemsonensis]|uniref:hypothetical protein n=1 Tax=Legionella clemsonensis TaxID=1867846 RepID=UPI000B8C8C34|nr:hypothetical protein [Legionella clemsonensis]